MFIATYNAIYAVGDDGNSEPTLAYEGTLGGMAPHGAMAVSYTHLTLPTIYSV